MHKVINFDIKGDDRGSLISLEQNKNIPFEIKRMYYIFDTKTGISRGFHAHKKLRQVLICLSGSCKLSLDNGHEKKRVILSSPSKGVLLEGLVWREMADFSSDCVLAVLADGFYDESDYIRDYNEFLELANKKW